MDVVDRERATKQYALVETEGLDEHEVQKLVEQSAILVVGVNRPGAHDSVGDDLHFDFTQGSPFSGVHRFVGFIGFGVSMENLENFAYLSGAASVEKISKAKNVNEANDALFVVGVSLKVGHFEESLGLS